MEKLLLISASTTLEDRLSDLLDSPRHVARASSWSEARRLVSKTSPSAVLIDSPLAIPSMASEMVALDSVLSKDGKKAYLLGDDSDSSLVEWTKMFVSFDAVVAPPNAPRAKSNLSQLLKAHISASEKKSSQPCVASKPSEKKETSEVIVRLPEIKKGALASVPLGRVIYSLYVRESTGVLQLSSGKVSRNFAFSEGRFVTAPKLADANALTSAYAWPDGNFAFQARHDIAGTPTSLYDLMMTGLRTYRNHRQIMQDLMPRMNTFPVVTQFWKQRNKAFDWDVLQRFINLCDGHQSLETIFSQMGRDVTEAFCSAVFARDTDLVVFRGEETSVNIRVNYDHASGAATSRQGPASLSKYERATGTQRRELEKELNTYFTSISKLSAHDIFGLWEGCGREMVKETYYLMVKEHHPDVYGGNVSGEVRKLSQRIFVRIRQTYTELMKVEGEQAVAPPDPVNVETSPRQRRRQMATLHPGQTATSQEDKTQQPGRRKSHTSPIKMGRTPTTTHPDLTQRQENADTSRERTSTPAPSSRKSRTRSSGASKRPRRTTTSGSSGDIGDATSDPEWRKERMERLKRSSSRSRRPTPMATNKKQTIPSAKTPADRARSAFNAGYKKFKDDQHAAALKLFKKAHETQPDNGLYMTFFAYCLFLTDPAEKKRSSDLLAKAIETKNRQALPDAHLFMGKILKVNGRKKQAHKHFKEAFRLNPGARDAEREIRLYERRQGDGKKKSKDKSDGSGSFLKKLFKK